MPDVMYPIALKPGDTFGVFSPSSPATHFAPKRTARAVEFLKRQGYGVKMGSLSGQSDAYRSGSISERAEELNALLRDPKVRCVIASIGGSNSNSLLPHIDYEALRRDPKIVCGYSDVTAIHAAIQRETGLVTFYGPALTASFGELEPLVSQTWRGLIELIGAEASAPYEVTTPEAWTEEFIDWEEQDRAKVLRPNALTTLRPGRARGRLVGGNLNTLYGVLGTPYEPIVDPGDVLLIEDSLKGAAEVERMFARLHHSGVLERAGGLILGKHELFDDEGSGRRPHEILVEVLGGLPSIPTLVDYDCAHTHPMVTLPLGALVELNATAQRLTVLERCVR